jgi:DUF4097 and DUF4098 domain-containing protein YvlB
MRGRSVAAVVAAALIVLGATTAVVSLGEMGWDLSRQSAENMQERTYSAEEEFQTIAIDVTTADIHLISSPDETCRVHIYEQKMMPIRVDVTDGCLQIRQEDNREWYDHIEIGYVQTGRVEIALPETAYEELHMELTTGDVTISEELRFRSVKADLTTGDVDCKARITDVLDIHATTGDIRVAAGNSEASVKLRVTTGDITVRDTICETLEIKATTGDAKLELCDARTIRVSSTTGDVTGMILSGKEFRTHTTTGDVDIPANGNGGVCDIQTTTGDISIHIKAAGE